MQTRFADAHNLALALVRSQMILAAEKRNQMVVQQHRPSTALQAIDNRVVVRHGEVIALAAYAAFKIGSHIRFRYTYMDRIVQAALELLRTKSPVGSAGDQHPGLYRDSHLVFIDGQVVPDAKSWLPGQQINISNPVPYARKIETGHIRMTVAPHVYEDAAQILAERFAGQANIRFVYMPVRFGGVDKWAKITQQQRDGRRTSVRARRDWLARQPALQITAR